ncbi:aldolase/citrate lyase family protein [Akkermansiaceae bacterium]|nr:aldolase/citrate lyase family protein [Akkermansiaceae bacterium]
MQLGSFRKKLLSGRPVIGSWINSGSPIITEIMANSGFDFLCVDVEHSAVDLPQTQTLFQAARSGNQDCHCLVRLHGVDYSFVKRYLDAGASGVIAPLVNSAEQAQTLVEATKYPPFGNRGVGFCRANDYGASLKEYYANANDDIMVGVQIEHFTGVKNIDSILEVKGVDAVFIGPYDLSASLGVPAQFDHPVYLEARDQVIEACRRHNIVPGIHVVHPQPQELLDRVDEGYRLLAYSLDITMLMDSCARGLGAIREQIGS